MVAANICATNHVQFSAAKRNAFLPVLTLSAESHAVNHVITLHVGNPVLKHCPVATIVLVFVENHVTRTSALSAKKTR